MKHAAGKVRARMTGTDSQVTAYIAVGSNIRPEKNVPIAVELLGERVEVVGVSTFYRTKALHRPEQADYRNGVVAFRTSMTARELRDDVLRPIEVALDRKRSVDKYAPRTMDLDLVLFGDEVVRETDLNLPDDDLRARPFVAVPLLELAPELVLPDDGARLADLPAAQMTQDLETDTVLSDRLKERLPQ